MLCACSKKRRRCDEDGKYAGLDDVNGYQFSATETALKPFGKRLSDISHLCLRIRSGVV
jgi:hypothetical protein